MVRFGDTLKLILNLSKKNIKKWDSNFLMSAVSKILNYLIISINIQINKTEKLGHENIFYI